MDYQLIKPTLELEKEILTYQAEFFPAPNGIHGTSSLSDFTDISQWLQHLYLYENRETMPNKSFVPGHQYVLLRPSDQKIIGMLHLRLELNDYLFNYAGHIGYSIAPSERKKGYGTMMLKKALIIAKDFDLERVLITCDDSNLGSIKVIEANNGILENKSIEPGSAEWTRRYWISLT